MHGISDDTPSPLFTYSGHGKSYDDCSHHHDGLSFGLCYVNIYIFQMYKTRLESLTKEKEALQSELESKCKELEQANKLIDDLSDQRTRLKS